MNESKNWLVWLVVVIALALGASVWLLNSRGTESDNTAAVGNISKNKVADALVVNDQFPGAIVYLTSVTLNDGGWAVVQKEDGTIMGTQYFGAGTDVGIVNLSELTEEGKNYTASLYGDNGDKVFDLKTDLPLRNAAGQNITTRFLATQNLPEVKG